MPRIIRSFYEDAPYYEDDAPLASESRTRNRKRAPFVVQCGHCNRKYRRMAAGVAHVEACAESHRPYQYGRR